MGSTAPSPRHSGRLSGKVSRVSFAPVNEKRNLWLPVLLMLAFAATRWPGLLPPNFSAAYALVFCAGVYLPGRLWWLPLATLAVTDIGLTAYYSMRFEMNAFQPTQLFNYVVYGVILLLGRKFRPTSSWVKVFGGGVLAALLFYFLTNTAAWFFNPFGNPEYTKDLIGWLTALTKGTSGYPTTWEFFRNSLLSGGLFAGLFAGAMKWTASAESPLEKDPTEAPQETPAEEPLGEEAKA